MFDRCGDEKEGHNERGDDKNEKSDRRKFDRRNRKNLCSLFTPRPNDRFCCITATEKEQMRDGIDANRWKVIRSIDDHRPCSNGSEVAGDFSVWNVQNDEDDRRTIHDDYLIGEVIGFGSFG